jgi:hypothetical protein
MKLLYFLISITCLFVLGTGERSSAQIVAVANIVDAPFTATWTWTHIETKSDGTETKTVAATAHLVRDRNGSTYEAELKDGHPIAIWIVDVLKNRKVEIHPLDFTYRYLQIPEPAGKLRTHTMAEFFNACRCSRRGSLNTRIIQPLLYPSGISQCLAVARRRGSIFVGSEMRLPQIHKNSTAGTHGGLISA